MNYEILTSRWHCPECASAIRLFFYPREGEEGSSDEFICINVLCQAGHELPQDLANEAMQSADEEFYAAMERGVKISEGWRTPADTDAPYDPPEVTT